MNEQTKNYLKRISDASGILGQRKKEPYIPPDPEQVKSSLIAMQKLLDGRSENNGAIIAMITSKWVDMMIRGNAEERVSLANDLYILGSGRNANLELEAPEIVAAIRYERRPLEKGTMIREFKNPVDLLRTGIQAKLESFEQSK